MVESFAHHPRYIFYSESQGKYTGWCTNDCTSHGCMKEASRAVDDEVALDEGGAVILPHPVLLLYYESGQRHQAVATSSF